jgi:hypothetical protein
MMVASVNNQLTCTIVELSAIAQMRKHKGLHEGHHFIRMSMEVHNKPMHDMDYFINKCVHLFHNK